MIQKQKINLAELKRKAEQSGARVIKSCSRSRCYITDGREIVIATTEGAVRVPIKQAVQFIGEITFAAKTAADQLAELTIAQKNAVAKEKGMTYGKLQTVIMELGGRKNEQEN